MENLKIRVNNEAESKEVQQLFFELGYKWFKKEHMEIKTPEMIMSFENGALSTGIRGSINHKEITLPQLRDLVVLKRNSIEDAQFEDNFGDKWYVDSSLGFWMFEGKCWRKATKPLFELKPIYKNQMKEYLDKNRNYELVLCAEKDKEEGFIEVPEGAEFAIYFGAEYQHVSFYKNVNDELKVCSPNFPQWSETKYEKLEDIDYKSVSGYVVWQRHTQPEELPFVDDEPNLNDQYAEIEKVRQDIINSPGHYADSTIECIDAMEAMMTPEQFIGYLRGNVFKYQWRYEKKNGIEDLKKAQWYLDKLTVKVAEKNALF